MAESTPRPNGRVRIGLIGCGYWGDKLLRNFAATEGCDVVAIADVDADHLSSASSRVPGASLLADPHDLIARDGVDAVVLATPVATHYPLAAQALDAGKHVLVEKPLTRTVEEAERLVELAARRQRVLMVDHTFLYSGAVHAAKRVIDDGSLGQVLFIDSARVGFGAFQTDVTVIDDLSPHEFSILEYILGSGPRSVAVTSATPAPSEGGIPVSAAHMRADFDGGVSAHLSLSWMSPIKQRRTLICGTRQMLLYDDTDLTAPVKVFDWSLQGGGRVGRVTAECDFDNAYVPPVDRTEPLARMAAHYVESINNGTPPLTDGAAGLRIVRALEGARASLAAGGASVTLPG